MQGADRADDPLVLASVARAGTHAVLAVGLYEDARQLAGPLRVGAPRVDNGRRRRTQPDGHAQPGHGRGRRAPQPLRVYGDLDTRGDIDLSAHYARLTAARH
jgi:hypothetical protein